MKPKINVRGMVVSDLDKVVALERTYFDQPITGKRLEYELLENELAHFYVAELADDVVGYIGFWVTGENADIMNIVVDKTVRRQGIGRLLLAEMIDYCANRALKHVSLEVRQSNCSAIKLYEQFGFKYIRKRKHYYQDGEDALYMVMQLGGK